MPGVGGRGGGMEGRASPEVLSYLPAQAGGTVPVWLPVWLPSPPVRGQGMREATGRRGQNSSMHHSGSPAVASGRGAVLVQAADAAPDESRGSAGGGARQTLRHRLDQSLEPDVTRPTAPRRGEAVEEGGGGSEVGRGGRRREEVGKEGEGGGRRKEELATLSAP